ncbi:MAG: hypothetical protein CL678_11450 [Bdellovibrionaceae bacterium]|nr:hypothetical protein [Pseudobdellovibrionaceae bacterium]
MQKFFKELEALAEMIQKSPIHFEQWVTQSMDVTRMEKLPGDASTRMYYRIWTENQSYILMKRDSFEDQKDDLPFLVIRDLLEKSNVDVPKVHYVDAKNGFIVLEDLGDVTLLRHLQKVVDREIERQLYTTVIDQLVNLHYFASPEQSGIKTPSYELRFSKEKLLWETAFTVEHFYEKHLSRKITEKDKNILDSGFDSICETLSSQREVFCHRDFHSRNVMVQPQDLGELRLVMIDFQDARMGPQQYDLVSLLKDSYYQLDENQIQGLVDYYVVRWEAVSGEKLDKEEFNRIFDLMTVQRNFKAIGSFASFLNRRGNSTYLKYIGNTFENIRRVLLKYPEFSDLREVLFHYYYF